MRVSDTDIQLLKRFILDKTEGNPFFMEEIIQELTEQGVLTRDVGAGLKPAPTLHIPPTVQAVLASRIDRLPPEEKELLQTLAVIGKEFSLGLLKQVVDQSEDTLQQLLSRLQTAEFIYEQPAFPESAYVFKHALTQEVAYNSLLVERRKGLHERAAKAIETIFQSRLEDRYSELANHYTRSGNTQKAIDYLQLAGQQAVQRSANAEAITHLTTALELLKTLPDTPERTRQEILLHVTLGPALIVTKGYAASETGIVYRRARELCQQLGETSQLFSILWGLGLIYLARPDFTAATELGEQLLEIAMKDQDSALLVEAHYLLGLSAHWPGNFVRAREYIEQSVIYYDAQKHRSHIAMYGQVSAVHSLCCCGLILWQLGYPDQARNQATNSITLAREAGLSYSVATALTVTATIYQLCREDQETLRLAETAIALSIEHGFPYWTALGTYLQGWVLAEQGQGEEGITLIRQGIADLRDTGSETGVPQMFGMLAEACAQQGRIEEGFSAITEALSLVAKNDEHLGEPELYRLKGELTLAQESKEQGAKSKKQKSKAEDSPESSVQSPEIEAETCFRKALEVSRRQQAKSLELRATMSLARLWQQQGKRDEARKMLAEIYGWFTEGFDTPDLKDAKALLAELAEPRKQGRSKRQPKRRKDQ